jgi:hypothetical protein
MGIAVSQGREKAAHLSSYTRQWDTEKKLMSVMKKEKGVLACTPS